MSEEIWRCIFNEVRTPCEPYVYATPQDDMWPLTLKNLAKYFD